MSCDNRKTVRLYLLCFLFILLILWFIKVIYFVSLALFSLNNDIAFSLRKLRWIRKVAHLSEKKHWFKTSAAILIGKAMGVNSKENSTAEVPKAVCGCIQHHICNFCDGVGTMCISICLSIGLFQWHEKGVPTAWVTICPSISPYPDFAHCWRNGIFFWWGEVLGRIVNFSIPPLK